MPLYELFCVAVSSAQSAPLRELIRTTSKVIIDQGGAVRGMQYWGRRALPQRAKRHQQWHDEGDHFLLQFDTNPRVLGTISSRLRSDPRVIKCTTLKLGERLDQITPSGSQDSVRSRVDHTSHMGGGRTVLTGNIRY